MSWLVMAVYLEMLCTFINRIKTMKFIKPCKKIERMKRKGTRICIKLLTICFLLATISNKVLAQTFPDFKIRLTSGKVVSSVKLSLHKPTIIIVFSPDCGHCQVLIDGIFKKINSFKKANIILATFVQEKDIIAFEKKYQTAKYPNITVGTDMPIFFLQKYYQLTNTPFTALYNKQGKLIVSYKKEHITEDLLKQLEKLP